MCRNRYSSALLFLKYSILSIHQHLLYKQDNSLHVVCRNMVSRLQIYLECTSVKTPFTLYYYLLQLCRTIHWHKTSPKVSGMFLLSLVTSESLMIVPSFRSVLKRNRPDSSSSSSSSSDSSFVSS